jgi:phenylalanyl-tRNA synthetase beta chain
LLHPGEEALILPSPISVEMSAMRLSLWTGLLSAVVYNQNRQQSRVRFSKAAFALCLILRQI